MSACIASCSLILLHSVSTSIRVGYVLALTVGLEKILLLYPLGSNYPLLPFILLRIVVTLSTLRGG
nr:MAG TPA: hypothetical protein [Caudoviricetes sp.]